LDYCHLPFKVILKFAYLSEFFITCFDCHFQVRVVQGKEPTHFLAMFQGQMVVYQGGNASAFDGKQLLLDNNNQQ
jgi:hypothetical protein